MSRKPKRLEPFGIKGIEVSRFRAMHDLEIGLGRLVTVIAVTEWDEQVHHIGHAGATVRAQGQEDHLR